MVWHCSQGLRFLRDANNTLGRPLPASIPRTRSSSGFLPQPASPGMRQGEQLSSYSPVRSPRSGALEDFTLRSLRTGRCAARSGVAARDCSCGSSRMGGMGSCGAALGRSPLYRSAGASAHCCGALDPILRHGIGGREPRRRNGRTALPPVLRLSRLAGSPLNRRARR